MSNCTTTRKTIEVGYVLDRANAYLRLTPDECTEGRRAVAGLIESVLMEANVYKGFGYTKSIFDENGVYVGSETAPYQGSPDETRRQYYRHSKLA